MNVSCPHLHGCMSRNLISNGYSLPRVCVIMSKSIDVNRYLVALWSCRLSACMWHVLGMLECGRSLNRILNGIKVIAACAWQAVLICGWQDTPFMLELLSDLDHGNNRLPRGSEVTLMNLHEGEEIARHLKRLGRCRIAIRHIEANPLHRESFKKVVASVQIDVIIAGHLYMPIPYMLPPADRRLRESLSVYWTKQLKVLLVGENGRCYCLTNTTELLDHPFLA